MKRLMLFFLVLVLLALAIAGCANPEGRIGPAWDTNLQIPLLEEEREYLKDMLDGDDFNFDGQIVEFNYEEEIDSFDYAELMEDFEEELNISESEDIDLESIELTEMGIIQSFADLGPIPGGTAYDDLAPEVKNVLELTLDFDQDFDGVEFDALELGEKGMKVTIKNQASDDGDDEGPALASVDEGVTIEGLKLIFSDDNGLNKELEFGDLGPGDEPKTKELKNVKLSSQVDVKIVFDKTTGDGSSEFSKLDLDFEFDEIEIIAIENFKFNDGVDDQDFDQTITIDDFDAALKSITFESGILSLSIDDDELGFNINVQKFNLINNEEKTFEGEDKDGTWEINLAEKELDLEQGIEVEVEIKTEFGDTISYNSRDQVQIETEFRDIKLSSVIVDISSFEGLDTDLADMEERIDIASELDDDLHEELKKLKGSEEAKFILEFIGLGDLKIKTDIKIKAYDKDGQPIDADAVELEEDNGTLSFDGKLINLILHEDTDYLKVEGSIDLDKDQTGEITINREDQVEINLKANIPLDFELSEALEYELDPESIDEISQDDADLLKDVINSARLKAKLDNQLEFGVQVQFYVASVESYEDDDQLKEQLYKAEHKLATKIEIKAKTNDEDFEIPFEVDDADRFTEDNLYVGVKVILPEGNITLRSEDYIEIKEAYVAINVKVNQ